MDGTPAISFRARAPKLIGGLLCLDFINTVEWRGDAEQPLERLTGYDELIAWAQAAGALSRAEASRARTEARRRPDDAEAALAAAVALREALARLLLAPTPADLALVNQALDRAPSRTAIVPRAHGFTWDSTGGEVLWRPLWPVLWSATDLLTSDRLARVRRCADARCGWHFLDSSRNRSRRWCAMADCGNRAKARRHYARRTEAAPSP